MAEKLDLEIDQGSTFEHELTWYAVDETPIDLTDYTARMQVREKLTDSIKIFDLTTENGGIVLGGAAGTITINISASASSAVSVSKNVYDLEVESLTGFVTRLVQGRFYIDPEVTR